MSCFQNSSFPKVVAKSLNIFEQFQVLVKLQAFSFSKNYLRFLVFKTSEDGSRNPIRRIWSSMGSSWALEVVKYFGKSFHFLSGRVPGSISAICLYLQSGNWSFSRGNLVLKLCKYPRKTPCRKAILKGIAFQRECFARAFPKL